MTATITSAGASEVPAKSSFWALTLGSIGVVFAEADDHCERLLRDAHAGLLLPPSHDATLQWLGRVELGSGTATGGSKERSDGPPEDHR